MFSLLPFEMLHRPVRLKNQYNKEGMKHIMLRAWYPGFDRLNAWMGPGRRERWKQKEVAGYQNPATSFPEH